MLGDLAHLAHGRGGVPVEKIERGPQGDVGALGDGEAKDAGADGGKASEANPWACASSRALV